MNSSTSQAHIDESAWKRSALFWFCAIGTFFNFAYGANFFFEGHIIPALLELIFGSLGLTLGYLLRKTTFNFSIIARITAALYVLHLLLFSILLGGDNLIVLLHFTIFPSLYLYFLGTLEGVAWSALGLAVVLIFGRIFPTLLNIPPTVKLDATPDVILGSLLFVYIAQTGLNGMFQRQRQRRIDALEKANQEISLRLANEEQLKKQRTEAEYQKEQLNQQVLAASKLATIGELAAGIAHEINNPLMIIQGHLDALSESLGDDQEDLSKQQIAVNRIRSIVDGLRNYARSDSSHGPLKPINLHHNISESVHLLQQIYLSRGITLTQVLGANVHYAPVSPGKFSQILLNLLSNAHDAVLGRVGATIVVSSINLDDRIRITVTDNGHGIPKELQPKIFDKFFTTKESGRGTGMGLSIVQALAQELGGTLSFASQPGIGSSFMLELHAFYGASNRAASAKPGPEPKTRAKSSESPKKLRVVLVDDERHLLEILEKKLTKLGHQIQSHSDPIVALEQLKTNHSSVDLIMTDMNMPKMSGVEIIKVLRDLNVNTPVILISGNMDQAQDLISRDPKGLSGTVVMGKPFSMDDIQIALGGFFGRT